MTGAAPAVAGAAPAPALSAYEQQRLANIARNQRELESLGLASSPRQKPAATKPPRKKARLDAAPVSAPAAPSAAPSAAKAL